MIPDRMGVSAAVGKDGQVARKVEGLVGLPEVAPQKSFTFATARTVATCFASG